VLGVDPGTTPSGITRRGGWIVHMVIGQFLIAIIAMVSSLFSSNTSVRTNTESAKSIVAAMFKSNGILGERPRGLYLDGDVDMEMAREARDPEKTLILWKDSIRYTGLQAEDTALKFWN
jgi:hypothetical protein